LSLFLCISKSFDQNVYSSSNRNKTIEIKNKKQISVVAAILAGIGLIAASATMTTSIPKAYAMESVCSPNCTFSGGTNPNGETGGGADPNYDDCPSYHTYISGFC
jgi:hypothetical protein